MMFDISKPANVVVIGGSLSGLFTSIPLLRLSGQQHSITILERNPTPLLHDQGAGIVAGSETLEWFRRHGVKESEDISVASDERLYLDLEGGVVDREVNRQRMTSWGLVYGLCRLGFDGVRVGGDDGDGLLAGRDGEGKGRAVYRYGCDVSELRDLGDQVEVRFVEKVGGDGGGQREGKEESIWADFVIVADGPSSRLRGILLADQNIAERKYAGYMAFRGTVSESALSDAAREVFVQKFTFFHGHDPNTQILAYTIPGPDGSVEVGKRLVNWVWYWNFQKNSVEYEEVMTDVDGQRHRFTLPTGGRMQKHVWTRQLDLARTHLPPQFSEIIEKTELPFAQAITDLEPPALGTEVGRLLNGKAVLVGDALAGFRPHTAASTSQAAYHGLLLEKVFLGQLDWPQYEDEVLNFAQNWQARGVLLGQRSQFGVHPLAGHQAHEKKEVDRKELWMRK